MRSRSASQAIVVRPMAPREVVDTLEGIEFERLPSGTAVARGVEVGEGAFIGGGATLYPGVVLGRDCVVLDGAVLGRMPIPNVTTTRPVRTAFGEVVVGNGSIVGANTVLYTDTRFGSNVLVGDLTSVREGCEVGEGAILGRGVMALYDCSVGAFSRVQDQVHLVGDMVVEEHVFIGMGTVTTNDNDVYLARFGHRGTDEPQHGPTIRRFAMIGAGSTILPNLEIGEGAFVAAGAVVTKDVPPWTVYAGVPAREVRAVPDEWRRKVERAAAARER
jgi:acetyltransferase-like isoleucine patch superfamily enzyme